MGSSVPLVQANRARVDAINPSDLASVGVVSSSWQNIVGTLQDLAALLPVSPKAEYWKRTGYESVWAIGFEGGISARKIRTVLKIAGFNNKIQKVIGRILPSLSLGATIGIGDNDTIFRVEGKAGLPRGVENLINRWGNSLTIGGANPFKLTIASATISNSEIPGTQY